MKKNNLVAASGILALILITALPVVVAQTEEAGDYLILGLELEKLLSLLNGIIALILCIIAFIAYRNDGRSRFLYVGVAFLIFSIKSFLVSSEIFFSGLDWIDPLSIVLEFLVILAFFFGVVKKGG